MINQTPWFERKFDFGFPVGYFPVILERLRGTVPHLENLVKNKTDDILVRKIDNAWSVKEHIGHLSDLEELWYARVEDFLAGKEILSSADLRNTKTHEANHNQKLVGDLIHRFYIARNKLIEKVQGIDESTASVTSLHPRLQTPMRLIDSLFFVAEHDDHHLAVIRQLVSTVTSYELRVMGYE
jgi:uncharacterized damage-inducible protein DinB